MQQPIRSVLAIIGGFLAMTIIVILCTVLYLAVSHLKSGHPTPVYLAVNLVYSLSAACFGGWLTARIAKRAPLLHGVALAISILAFGLFNLRNPAPGQSYAYQIFLDCSAPLSALAGAALYKRDAI